MMPPAVKTTISVQKALYDQAEILAKRLNLSRSQFLAMAVENFIQDYLRQQPPGESQPAEEAPDGKTADARAERREIRQGDVFWVPLEEAGVVHPHVVVQDDVFNRSRIHTVVVCALTSNIQRAKAPGNVLLEAGEANLPRQSVVEVSKVSAVYKKQFGEYIGSLNKERVDQILAGMRFLQTMAEHGDGEGALK